MMTELEVEPVERIDDIDALDVPTGIDGPEYVLYGGKGGVGKTTMAAATALASARAEVPTLVVSTDPAHSLSDAFELDIPNEPMRLDESIPLYGVEIDPESALHDIDADPEPTGLFGDLFGSMTGDSDHPVTELFGGPMPGSDEIMAMQQLLRFLDDDRFDRVVIDTAPTGHTLRLLGLPDLLDSMLGRMIQVQERIRSVIGGMKGMFSGEDDLGDPSVELDQLRQRIERLRAVLQDPDRTDFRIVLVPEEMSVIEAERLREQLREFSIPVSTVVVNRIMEPLDSVVNDDAARLVSPDLDGCAFCQRRWRVQQSALERAQDLFRDHTVKRVPLFADEVRGMGRLSVVAACLD